MSNSSVGMGSTATLQDGIKQVCPGAIKEADASIDEAALQKELEDFILWRVWRI